MFFRILLPIAAAFSTTALGATPTEQKPVSLNSEVKLVHVVQSGAVVEDDAIAAGGVDQQGAVKGTDGKFTLVDPKSVVPGDTLVFITDYTNSGQAPVSDFVIVNPVPKSVKLSSQSAGHVEVSVDGGKHFGMLSTLTVPDANGALRAATADDVTHLRWTITRLAAGQSGRAVYSAVVR
ncbi:MAG TPA: hypothetical protein VF418_09680 [Sphingomonadaceae bacterium]